MGGCNRRNCQLKYPQQLGGFANELGADSMNRLTNYCLGHVLSEPPSQGQWPKAVAESFVISKCTLAGIKQIPRYSTTSEDFSSKKWLSD